jgi:hypothetical protein
MTTPKDFDTLPTDFKLYDFNMTTTVPYIQIKSDIASFGSCIENECSMNEPIQVFCQSTVGDAKADAKQILNLYLPYKGTIVARPYTFSDSVVTTPTKIYEFVHTVNVLKDDIISFTYDGKMLTITDPVSGTDYTLSIYIPPKSSSYRSSSDSDTFYILAFSDDTTGALPTTPTKPFAYTLVNFLSTDKPPDRPKTPLSTLAIVLISSLGFILLFTLIFFFMNRNSKKD